MFSNVRRDASEYYIHGVVFGNVVRMELNFMIYQDFLNGMVGSGVWSLKCYISIYCDLSFQIIDGNASLMILLEWWWFFFCFGTCFMFSLETTFNILLMGEIVRGIHWSWTMMTSLRLFHLRCRFQWRSKRFGWRALGTESGFWEIWCWYSLLFTCWRGRAIAWTVTWRILLTFLPSAHDAKVDFVALAGVTSVRVKVQTKFVRIWLAVMVRSGSDEWVRSTPYYGTIGNYYYYYNFYYFVTKRYIYYVIVYQYVSTYNGIHKRKSHKITPTTNMWIN